MRARDERYARCCGCGRAELAEYIEGPELAIDAFLVPRGWYALSVEKVGVDYACSRRCAANAVCGRTRPDAGMGSVELARAWNDVESGEPAAGGTS